MPNASIRRRPPVARLILAILVVLAAVGSPGSADAQAQPRPSAKKPAPKPAPAAPPEPAPAAEAPVALPEPPLPVVQARDLGLGQCAPILDLMARRTLTSRYDVQSGWHRADPSRHIFQSVAALTKPGNVPPDGIAALVAAPLASGGCDGVALQVFPLAGDCPSAQKTMLAEGKTVGALMNARVMQDKTGQRIILLPAYNDTCIAIAVDSHFGPP